ncbi:MAG: hypothetical protein IPI35_35020 [Deltaproteobacteria bacterium]|nr:hypothetical protein [Deltaproteobacteria bacterium]
MRAAVIVGLNVHATLAAVLAALPPGLPTFVVDDGSAPPLTAPAGVTLLRHNKNRGYGAARARAIRRPGGGGHADRPGPWGRPVRRGAT